MQEGDQKQSEEVNELVQLKQQSPTQLILNDSNIYY